MRQIIAFTGMPFSGKTEAVKVGKNMGITVLRMGDLVWEEVERKNLELNSENVGRIATQMRKEYGKDIWAKKTLDKIKKLNQKELIIIDGIRNPEEVNFFKKEFNKHFVLIAIKSFDKQRYLRAVKRNRKDDSNDIKKIKQRDRREIKWGLKKVIEKADIKISNNKDLESFKNKVKNQLKKYR
ncbi:MAG: AAA family ATPase [Candidatus Thermoplasmatota archaeon]